jgi:hypothetical protein
MSDFIQFQTQYITAKKNYEAAEKKTYLARQQYLMDSTTARQKAWNDSMDLQKKAETLLKTARINFEQVGDVRKIVNNMPDNIPVLLLPLRIQTRYLTTKHIARNCPEALLVDINKINTPANKQKVQQIFPDMKPKADPLKGISSQAYLLSNKDLPNVKTLINALNSSATQKRWQKTEDKYELCVRFFPDEVFLHTHETALTAVETEAGKQFWTSMLDAQLPPVSAAEKKEKQVDAWQQLHAAFGPPRAAWIAAVLRPDNFPETQLPAGQVLKFPSIDQKSEAWTLPPRTNILPERLVARATFKGGGMREATGLSIPDFLEMGFNPDEQNNSAFSTVGATLELPAAIKWLTDFDEAVRIGMAVRIPLSKAEYLAGVDRLVVMGIKAGADQAEGTRLLGQLFDNHHFKSNGMAFLPQGTPTNNLEGQPSGFSTAGLKSGETFDYAFTALDPNNTSSDGRHLAAALGLSNTFFDRIFNSRGTEAEEALAINRALWPATMGYYLDQLMRPALKDADIAKVKSFFQKYVTGRGLLSPIRVGKQPYGIIPTTAWSIWQTDANATPEEQRMVALLKKLDQEWSESIQQVKTIKSIFEQNNTVEKEDKLRTEFRQLLSVQASSTRFFRRLIAGEYLLWNMKGVVEPDPNPGIKKDPKEYLALLQSANGYGKTLTDKPRILGKFLDNANFKLTDFKLDNLAGSNITNDEGENYLFMVLDATANDLRDFNFGPNFNEFVKHNSSKLMFYLSRFSLAQEWISAATSVLKGEKANISPFARIDFEFEYLNTTNKPSAEHADLLVGKPAPLVGNWETRKNKWAFLEEKLSTGATVQENITARLKSILTETDKTITSLKDTRNALKLLSKIPDERLERLMTEHLDTCSFRLDAWMQGLVHERLATQRAKLETASGCFLGAYGYLENLKPDLNNGWIKILEIPAPVTVLANSVAVENLVMPVYDFKPFPIGKIGEVSNFVFVYLGSDPNTNIVQNAHLQSLTQMPLPSQVPTDGFLLTPSLEHATTAAILRGGYEHHAAAQGEATRALSINLNSERTGRAMDMLKGMQAGHSLNEQIGYLIEREMYKIPILAPLVPTLRTFFPLHIESQEWDDNQQINATDKTINLSLVLDGLALLESKKQFEAVANTVTSWKTFLAQHILNKPQVFRLALESVVNQAIAIFDAVGDLLLAESVYQTVKGSPERAAAALRTVSEGTINTLPEIQNIPSEGSALSHRMGFVLAHNTNDASTWPTTDRPTSAAALLAPALNRWLADQLPHPKDIFVTVTDVQQQTTKISLASIGIQAIDFFSLLQKTGTQPEQTLLTFLFVEQARKQLGLKAADRLEISFQRNNTFQKQEYSIRELLPLILCLARLLEKSRPMKPEDWETPQTATQPRTVQLDNSALLQAITPFINTTNNGLIPAFLKKLDSAIQLLQEDFPIGIDITAAQIAFVQLYELIPQAWVFGLKDAIPECPNFCDGENSNILLAQAARIKSSLNVNLAAAVQLMANASSTNAEQQLATLTQATRIFTRDDLFVLPRFKLNNPAAVKSTVEDPKLLLNAGEFGVEAWLQGLAVAREMPRYYQMLSNLREAMPGPAAERNLKILQLPFVADQPNVWIGAKFPEGFTPPNNVVSMAYEFSGNFDTSKVVSGILWDEWREKVPQPIQTAGVSINYNQPNNEAPQTMLLVVSPTQSGKWAWETLTGAVVETVDMARKRLVDTEIIQKTWMNQFLPALVAPVDVKNNTPALDFRVAGPVSLSIDDVIGGGVGGGTGVVFGG